MCGVSVTHEHVDISVAILTVAFILGVFIIGILIMSSRRFDDVERAICTIEPAVEYIDCDKVLP